MNETKVFNLLENIFEALKAADSEKYDEESWAEFMMIFDRALFNELYERMHFHVSGG